MTRPRPSDLLLALLVTAGCVAAPTGRMPSQSPLPQSRGAQPEVLLERLLPALGGSDLSAREAAQRELEQYALETGRPGTEETRIAMCRAICARLTPEVPQPARLWMLGQLERLGGAESVATLRALLDDPDPQIRELARRCLEVNPAPDAGAALYAALRRAQDPAWLAALVQAVGARRQEEATDVLVTLIRHPDVVVGRAATNALGSLANEAAREVLLGLWREADPARRQLAADALIRLGHRLIESNEPGLAATVFSTMLRETRPSEPDVLSAVLGGLARVNPQAEHTRIRYVAEHVPDDSVKRHAIWLLARMPIPEATNDLLDLLGSATMDIRVTILDALAERGDPPAKSAVQPMLDSFSPEVRAAAIRLWQVLGGPEDVAALATWAARGDTPEGRAGREALARLRGDGVEQALEAALLNAEPFQRAALIRALAARHSLGSADVIFEQLNHINEPVRIAAYEALATLASPRKAPELVAKVLGATPEDVRRAGEDAVVAVCGRIEPAADRARPVLSVWDSAPETARATLVRLLGRLNGPDALARIRQALADRAADVREEAVRALANWPTADVLPDLLRIATPGESSEASGTPASRVFALQGYIRLLGALEDEPTVALERYRRAFALAERPEEKKQALAGLATLQAPEALEIIGQQRRDDAVRLEAESAEISAALLLAPVERALALDALERVAESGGTPALRERAEKVLASVREAHGFLGAWSYDGPYAEPDRSYEWIHAHAFPPELSGASGTAWRPLRYTSAERPWIFDLTRLDRENHRCIYVRTYVWADEDGAARLELGSDDALKVWLNGELVHEYLGVRGHTPSQDKAPIRLRRGWNTLLLKVTQASGGWAFSCAVRGPGGEDPGALRHQAKPPEEQQKPPERATPAGTVVNE